MIDGLLTITEAAELVGRHVRTVERWVHRGHIEPLVVEGARLLVEHEVYEAERSMRGRSPDPVAVMRAMDGVAVREWSGDKTGVLPAAIDALIAARMTQGAIARRLGCSERTVERHRARLRMTSPVGCVS